MELMESFFSELNKRIDIYKEGITILNVEPPRKESEPFIRGRFSQAPKIFSRLRRKLIGHEEESIPSIEFALKELKSIKRNSNSIIKNKEFAYSNYITKEFDFTFGQSEKELKKRHKKNIDEAYENLKFDIDFYISNLTQILTTISNNDVSERKKIISVSEDSLPKLKPDSKQTKLTVFQFAWLFQKLQDEEVILQFDQTSMARIANLLTGTSFQTSRTAFRKTPQLSAYKTADGLKKDLEQIKVVLKNILQEVDIQLERASKRK